MEISTGHLYFNMGVGTSLLCCRMCFVLDEAVDGDALRRAVDTAMKRYPYLCVKPVFKNNEYTLEPNDKPVVVYEGDDMIALGNSELNEHLLAAAYCENRLYIDCFHGLMDGMGTMPVNSAILHYYSVYHYKETPVIPVAYLVDDPIDPAEYKDPFEYDFPDVKAFVSPVPKKSVCSS